MPIDIMKNHIKYRRVNCPNAFGLLLTLLIAFSARGQDVNGGTVELEIVRTVRMSFQTESGNDYRILTTSDVDSDDWVESGDSIEGTGKVYSFARGSDQSGKTFFKVEEDVADLGIELVPIPAGTFLMGSPGNEVGRSNPEGPQTMVTISKSFWMGKYEVTQGQFKELMGYNPSHNKNSGLNAPVDRVTRGDAVEFCQKLTRNENAAGRLPEGFEYRLPTEAQWEYACKAGTTTRFSYGDDPDYSDLDEYAFYGVSILDAIRPVGERLPNPWGLYDMHGNVWEWCLDWYGNYSGGEQLDWIGPDNGSFRVARGGGHNSSGKKCRSASRRFTKSTTPNGQIYTGYDLGFRPVLVSVQ